MPGDHFPGWKEALARAELAPAVQERHRRASLALLLKKPGLRVRSPLDG